MNLPLSTLIILDGFGSSTNVAGNAILSTPTPNLDFLWNHYQHTLIKAAEEEVGLSFSEMGNSEVGHLILGAGRVLYQSLPKINLAIQEGTFYKNPAFLQAADHVRQNNSALHIMGMVSVAGVHAHLDHMIALIKFAAEQKLPRVYLHVILDGRDSGPKEAPIFLEKLRQAMAQYKTGTIASVSGRAYTMDRNNNWERTQLAYNMLLGKSNQTGTDPLKVVQDNYNSGSDDENLLPTVILNSQNQPIGPLQNTDALIFSNYREDRARQITQALSEPNFTGFPRPNQPQNLLIVTMTQYQKDLPVLVAFPPEIPPNTLSDQLQNLGITQFHISETEKYAHVTYFFDGGRETPHPLEKFINVPSPKPETFQTQPQMAAPQVLKATLDTINGHQAQFILVNFANPDMIAHTGNFQATRTAVSYIDSCIGAIWQAIQAQNGYLFITADHGNCELMLDPATGGITKDHTTSPVPFIAAGPSLNLTQPTNDRVTQGSQVTGLLADVAPSILNILNLPIPKEMTGNPLFLLQNTPPPQN